MMFFMTVRKGMLEVHGDTLNPLLVVELTPKGLKQLEAFFKKNEVRDVMCSSSCDFPEDDGGPEGVDVRGFIEQALAWKK